MSDKPAKKKAKKKAVAPAGTIETFTITIPYRYDDGVGSYIYIELSEAAVYKAASKDMKIICKEEEKHIVYPNSKKFILDDMTVDEALAEFEFYYDGFASLGSVYDSSWSLTRTKINGSKITYTVEG